MLKNCHILFERPLIHLYTFFHLVLPHEPASATNKIVTKQKGDMTYKKKDNFKMSMTCS